MTINHYPQGLFILRHGEAKLSANSDALRSLTLQGKEEAKASAHYLYHTIKSTELSEGKSATIYFLVSSAIRTRETFEEIQNIWQELDQDTDQSSLTKNCHREFKDSLYLASASMINDHVLEAMLNSPSTPYYLILVGHNPGLSDFVHELTGNWLSLSTGEVKYLLPPHTEMLKWTLKN